MHEAMNTRVYGLGMLLLTLGLRLCTQAQADGIPEPSLVLYGVVSDTSAGGNFVTNGPLSWTLQPVGGGVAVVANGGLTNVNGQYSYVLLVPCETTLPGIPVSSNTLELASPPTLYNLSQVTVDGVPAVFVTPNLTNLTLTSTSRGVIERIDLNVNLNVGLLPAWWQLQYFGHLGVDPNDDPDHDGMSNMREYLDGTDPTDPNSAFKIVSVSANSTGVSIAWSSVLGKFYTVQRSSDLLSGFTDLQQHIVGTAPTNSFQDATSAGNGPFFYRIVVE
jgi:hypothetical protein